MHKVFISYHHKDQEYKDELVRMGERRGLFIDRSVDTGDISDQLSDQAIREKIRDNYLRDSTVTIVLVGQETRKRKHVDWEIYSSMFDGQINKKSGVFVVNLPSVTQEQIFFSATNDEEKKTLYPEISHNQWITSNSPHELKEKFPYMPARIIGNLIKPEAKVSVARGDKSKPLGLGGGWLPGGDNIHKPLGLGGGSWLPGRYKIRRPISLGIGSSLFGWDKIEERISLGRGRHPLISVTSWDKICEPKNLKFLVEATFADRDKCQYDLGSPMKRNNS